MSNVLNRRRVETPDAPTPKGSYSQGIVAGGFLFIAGQVPVNPETGGVPEEFGDQVRQVLENMAAVAQAAGTSLENAVRVGVYLSDLAEFDEMDLVYREHFRHPEPARTTVGAAIRGFRIEMDAIVATGEEG